MEVFIQIKQGILSSNVTPHKKNKNKQTNVYLEKHEFLVFSLIFILTSLEHKEWIILKKISIWKN